LLEIAIIELKKQVDELQTTLKEAQCFEKHNAKVNIKTPHRTILSLE
jgi:hypothetical protein